MTYFYNMCHSTHESTDTFTLKIHKEFEQVMKTQMNDVGVPISEKTVINQLISAVIEENVRRMLKERVLQY